MGEMGGGNRTKKLFSAVATAAGEASLEASQPARAHPATPCAACARTLLDSGAGLSISSQCPCMRFGFVWFIGLCLYTPCKDLANTKPAKNQRLT